jgi:hypothetical protein
MLGGEERGLSPVRIFANSLTFRMSRFSLRVAGVIPVIHRPIDSIDCLLNSCGLNPPLWG